MRSSHRKIWIGLIGSALASTLVLACTDDDIDALGVPDGGGDGSVSDAPPVVIDANGDGGPTDSGRQKSCVERPTDLDRPPTGRLPCNLIPPGLSL